MSEFWILDTGEIVSADGDIGDYNHAAHAYARAIQFCVDSLPDNEVGNRIRHAISQFINEPDPTAVRVTVWDICSELIEDGLIPFEAYEDPIEYLAGIGFDRESYDILNEEDPREWAMEKLGWIRVVNDSFTVWSLTRDELLRIGYAIPELFSGYDELEYNIEEYLSHTMFWGVPFAAIDGGDISFVRRQCCVGR